MNTCHNVIALGKMHKKLHIIVVSGKMAWGPGGQAEEGDVFFTFVLFEFYNRHVLSIQKVNIKTLKDYT